MSIFIANYSSSMFLFILLFLKCKMVYSFKHNLNTRSENELVKNVFMVSYIADAVENSDEISKLQDNRFIYRKLHL